MDDIGSLSNHIGYAGENSPKAYIHMIQSLTFDVRCLIYRSVQFGRSVSCSPTCMLLTNYEYTVLSNYSMQDNYFDRPITLLII